MRIFSGRGQVIIIIIGFSVRIHEADSYRYRHHRGIVLLTKLLCKKLESGLLDYLALSLVSRVHDRV